jgi:hypothetical protein
VVGDSLHPGYESPWTTALTHKLPLALSADPFSGTAYWWLVMSKDRAGNVNSMGGEGRWVTIKQPVPSAPVILAPSNGKYLNDSNDLLSWKPVNYASAYQLQISKTSTFSPLLVNDATLTNTTFDLTAPLPNNGTYYWRVRAINGEGVNGPYTAARSFVLDRIPPAEPALLKPYPGALVAYTPTFYWKAASGATYYRLVVWNGLDYYYESPWTTLLYRKPPAMPPGTYWWTVDSRDKAANLTISSTIWNLSINTP